MTEIRDFTLEVARYHRAECSCGWRGELFQTEFVAGSWKIGKDPWDELHPQACDQANNHLRFHHG